MSRFFASVKKRAGEAPGTLMHIGEKKTDHVRITLIDYDKNDCVFRELKSIDEAFECRDSGTVSWINLYGLHDVDLLKKLGAHYCLDKLVLEDILNTGKKIPVAFQLKLFG